MERNQLSLVGCYKICTPCIGRNKRTVSASQAPNQCVNIPSIRTQTSLTQDRDKVRHAGPNIVIHRGTHTREHPTSLQGLDLVELRFYSNWEASKHCICCSQRSIDVSQSHYYVNHSQNTVHIRDKAAAMHS